MPVKTRNIARLEALCPPTTDLQPPRSQLRPPNNPISRHDTELIDTEPADTEPIDTPDAPLNTPPLAITVDKKNGLIVIYSDTPSANTAIRKCKDAYNELAVRRKAAGEALDYTVDIQPSATGMGAHIHFRDAVPVPRNSVSTSTLQPPAGSRVDMTVLVPLSLLDSLWRDAVTTRRCLPEIVKERFINPSQELEKWLSTNPFGTHGRGQCQCSESNGIERVRSWVNTVIIRSDDGMATVIVDNNNTNQDICSERSEAVWQTSESEYQ